MIKVVTRTGRTEGSVDPQGPEGSDVFVILRLREEWRPGLTPEKLAEEIDKKLEGHSPGEFVAVSQPIEMRVNDLIAGVKSDVALKIYGDDLQEMSQLAEKLQAAIAGTPGAADVKREIPWGLPTIRVRINREKAARLGVAPKSILDAIEVARAGQKVGEIYEGERVFDLVLKISGDALKSEVDLARFPVQTMGGEMVPLSAVADIKVERGIFQITRDKLRRRLVVEANVRGRDLVGFVNDAKQRVAQVPVPPGIELAWGGQFENFQRANERLMMLVPVALGIIAVMLYLSYRSLLLTMCTLLSLPFALGGGLVSLFARGMPFSIPAMVGFIALAGVAVMSGVVLTTRLLDSGDEGSPEARVREAASSAFRPTISTALVAALGFIPMAIAKSAGAEVQRPLATVVIGGLLVGVVGSVLAMPAMLVLVMRRRARLAKPPVAPAEPGAAPTADRRPPTVRPTRLRPRSLRPTSPLPTDRRSASRAQTSVPRHKKNDWRRRLPGTSQREEDASALLRAHFFDASSGVGLQGDCDQGLSDSDRSLRFRMFGLAGQGHKKPRARSPRGTRSRAQHPDTGLNATFRSPRGRRRCGE